MNIQNCVRSVHSTISGRTVYNTGIRETALYYKVIIDGFEMVFHKKKMTCQTNILKIDECIDRQDNTKLKGCEVFEYPSNFVEGVTIRVLYNGVCCLNSKGQPTPPCELGNQSISDNIILQF